MFIIVHGFYKYVGYCDVVNMELAYLFMSKWTEIDLDIKSRSRLFRTKYNMPLSTVSIKSSSLVLIYSINNSSFDYYDVGCCEVLLPSFHQKYSSARTDLWLCFYRQEYCIFQHCCCFGCFVTFKLSRSWKLHMLGNVFEEFS